MLTGTEMQWIYVYTSATKGIDAISSRHRPMISSSSSCSVLETLRRIVALLPLFFEVRRRQLTVQMTQPLVITFRTDLPAFCCHRATPVCSCGFTQTTSVPHIHLSCPFVLYESRTDQTKSLLLSRLDPQRRPCTVTGDTR